MRLFFWIFALFTLLALPGNALAYIGPGAGFALVSSFFVLIAAFVVAFFTLLTLPVRATYLFIKRRKIRKKMKAKRVIVIGFDGMDPQLCRQYMAEGKLPNLAKLAETGCFKELQTTTPAISPVAWSTFSTGVNPGKHNIFDFFTRNPRNYLPVLSSAIINTRQTLRSFGPIRWKQPKTTVKLLRKSTSFWKILGEHKIFSTILRVPITFPPEKFYGVCLSAMCAPDLRGTQGSFTLLNSAPPDDENESKGLVTKFELQGTSFETSILGPSLSGKKGDEVRLPIKGTLNTKEQTVLLEISGNRLLLQKESYSPWTELIFTAGRRQKIHGIARFLLKEVTPHIKIYITPINIDPAKPTLPVSHPFYYSICLAKLHGPFSTLGLSEDTWALNEGVIDEQDFLNQTYDIYEDRKKPFLASLKEMKEGVLVNVFDTTDRIQHMFFRYLDSDHPANAGKETTLHAKAIEEIYMASDKLVGEVLPQIGPKDTLFVLSDHGFKPFKWGVNLNTWLWREGYLVLKEDAAPGKEWFVDVDWKKTRAYGFGLAGIFINSKGREKHGIVKAGKEKNALLQELKEKLEALTDPENNLRPIHRMILAQEELSGPYTKDAPDLLIGYTIGYRVSWNSAVGKITESVIEPNTKRWSGDHCLDPALVPGVLFSNSKVQDESPSLMDLAPTIVHLFGVESQRFHDGNVLQME